MVDEPQAEEPLLEDPNVQRRRLGIELRNRREALDLKQREAAEKLEWSLSKLIRVEAGSHGISVGDLKSVFEVYEITDKQQVASLVTAARGGRGRAWWRDYQDMVSPQFARYLGHEGMATSFQIFHPFLVPALLHTEEYARELLREFHEDPALRRLVELRMERQQRVFAQPGLGFTFVMGEEALYRWIGGPMVMRRQLEHLLNVSDRANVAVKIVPFNAGAYAGLIGPFLMLRLRESEEDVIFQESAGGDRLIRGDATVISRYADYFKQLSDISLAAERCEVLLHEQIRRLDHAGQLDAGAGRGR